VPISVGSIGNGPGRIPYEKQNKHFIYGIYMRISGSGL
jgi:hypothetical protein